jgi:hypothetical protein
MEYHLDKLLKLLDVSLVVTLGTGLVYLVGYRYLYVYYGYFGLNPLVRDPDVPMVLAYGFGFSDLLLLVLLASALAFGIGFAAIRWLSSRIFVTTPAALTAGAGLLVALGTFNLAYRYVDRYVIASANSGAMEAVKSHSGVPDATVTLKGDRSPSGRLRLFFFGKNDVVFLDYSGPGRGSPKVVIIPRGEVLSVVVN